MAKRTSPEVLKFLREIGREGGKAKAARHSKEELREWGRRGGRPRKDGKPPKKSKQK